MRRVNRLASRREPTQDSCVQWMVRSILTTALSPGQFCASQGSGVAIFKRERRPHTVLGYKAYGARVAACERVVWLFDPTLESSCGSSPLDSTSSRRSRNWLALPSTTAQYPAGVPPTFPEDAPSHAIRVHRLLSVPPKILILPIEMATLLSKYQSAHAKIDTILNDNFLRSPV